MSTESWGPLDPKYQRLLRGGNPSIVDQLGCFRCGSATGDVNKDGRRFVNCEACRKSIRQDMVRAEVERMDWPEYL